MRIILTLVPAIAAAIPLTLRAGAAGPSPEDIQVVSIDYSGNGCPSTSVSTSISPDRAIVTFGFDSFILYAGPGVAPSERSKNCALQLTVNQPVGFQFGVVEATWHGWMLLDEGFSQNFAATTSFLNDTPNTASFTATIKGGRTSANGQIFTESDSIAAADVVYSPCGVAQPTLSVLNRAALTSTIASNFGPNPDGEDPPVLTLQLLLSWREC